MKTHHQAVYQQFDQQANSYLTSQVHAQGEDLLVLQQLLQGCQDEDVLDLGCGAGHVSFHAAPLVKSVTVMICPTQCSMLWLTMHKNVN